MLTVSEVPVRREKQTVPRLALFLPSLEGGGAQRVMVTFANEFASLGPRVDLVVGSSEGPYRREISSAVRLVELGSPRVSRCLLPLVAYLRGEEPSWLISTMYYVNIVAVLAVFMAGHKTRIWVREAIATSEMLKCYSSSMAWGYRQAIRATYRRADGIIAPSQGVADDLSVLLGQNSSGRIHTVMNPIATREIEELAAQAPPEAVAAIPKPWIVACGRLDPQKGFDTLLRAFAELPAVSPERPSLIILGQGSERERLQQLSVELGISERCHFPGFVQNPFSVFRQATMFVLSSRFEGCPNVLLQAMACGTPVISTDCPSGPREILRDPNEGLLVPMEDPKELSRAIARRLEDPGDPASRRQRANDFAAPVMVRQLWELMAG